MRKKAKQHKEQSAKKSLPQEKIFVDGSFILPTNT
jgi:hypothetical protein